jgi:hypothetical protein
MLEGARREYSTRQKEGSLEGSTIHGASFGVLSIDSYNRHYHIARQQSVFGIRFKGRIFLILLSKRMPLLMDELCWRR